MLLSNKDLPQNVQDLISSMSYTQAVPLQSKNGVPYLVIKLSDNHESFLDENEIACEFKPSIFNVTYKGENIALCFVQFRLNQSNKHIFTISYDLKNDKQYEDCFDLLAMENYGLLIATNNAHEILQFGVEFKGDFKPQAMLNGARELASTHSPELFTEISFAISSQGESQEELWQFLNQMAPFEKRWYGAMQLGATKT